MARCLWCVMAQGDLVGRYWDFLVEQRGNASLVVVANGLGKSSVVVAYGG